MKKLFLIPLLVFAITAKAQEPKKNFSFSLEQAISHALTNNYSVINAGRDIAASKEKNGKLPQRVCHKLVLGWILQIILFCKNL